MRKVGAFIWYQKLHFNGWIQKWSGHIPLIDRWFHYNDLRLQNCVIQMCSHIDNDNFAPLRLWAIPFKHLIINQGLKRSNIPPPKSSATAHSPPSLIIALHQILYSQRYSPPVWPYKRATTKEKKTPLKNQINPQLCSAAPLLDKNQWSYPLLTKSAFVTRGLNSLQLPRHQPTWMHTPRTCMYTHILVCDLAVGQALYDPPDNEGIGDIGDSLNYIWLDFSPRKSSRNHRVRKNTSEFCSWIFQVAFFVVAARSRAERNVTNKCLAAMACKRCVRNHNTKKA